jgi:hypothetical protein
MKKTILPPPPPPLRALPAASSSSAATQSSYYGLTTVSPAGAAALEVRMLQESVDGLRHEISSVSAKMDSVIELIDSLRAEVVRLQ